MDKQDLQYPFQLAELKVTYDKKIKNSERMQITSSSEAASIFKKIWQDDIDIKERFYVLFLNRANKVIGYSLISEGGMNGTLVDIRLIFSSALGSLANSIIIAHNHPSGSLNPSDDDIRLTDKINEAGRILDIKLLDHIILTDEGVYSFSDSGRL